MGAVYVAGGVSVPEGQRVQIIDGTLIAEGTVRVARGASLAVTHSAATRALPGVLALDAGGLVVEEDADLRVHGLVLANRVVNIGARAVVDVVGSIWGGDPGLSVRILGTTIIRYDPAVLGTPALRVPAGSPRLVWVAAWEEIP
jgi:hypothetical protein